MTRRAGALRSRALASLLAAAALSGCDPGGPAAAPAGPAATSPGAASPGAASPGAASPAAGSASAGDLTGEWDYEGVVDLDAPDAAPGVETRAVRTQAQLDALRASCAGADDPLRRRALDLAREGLVVVVQPGAAPPVIRAVEVGDGRARVRYALAATSEPARARRGRYAARVVQGLPAQVEFVRE